MHVLAKTSVVTFVASTIEDGDFAVPTRPDEERPYLARVRRLMQAVGVENRSISVVRPCHGQRIALVDGNAPTFHEKTDGLLTRRDDAVLAVTGGDCPPVLIADPFTRSFALVHSGREGTLLNIAGEATKRLLAAGAPEAVQMQAWIGPGICRDHYEVDREFAEPFRRYPDAVIDHGRKCELGLAFAIRSQLMECGVCDIQAIPECTYAKPGTWFSYRRDKRLGVNIQRPRNHIFLAFAT